MFRKMPFILVAVIALIIISEPFIPLIIKQTLYSISLTIKSMIIFLLPIIIFGLLFKAVVSLSHGATKIIGTILVLVCCSNFISTFLSHYIGIWIYGFDLSIISPNLSQGLDSIWTINLPKLIANDQAMFISIIAAIIVSKLYPTYARALASKIEHYISKLLKSFTYIIPLFVSGFVVKMQYDNVAKIIVKDYTSIFIIIAVSQFSYILLSYFIFSNGKFQEFILTIRNMLPAAISGFSTMSSAASMPLTIIAAENNAKNKDIARSVVPVTVNIHLVGDCFAIPIFAYAVLKSFGVAEPSLWNYLVFTCYFVLAKFSVAAIPGGGIIVMLPILQDILGFNPDMMALITALYILFDPVITCANVLGNGAFVKMIDKYFNVAVRAGS